MTGVFSKGYSLRRHYVDRFFFSEAAKIPPGSIILDIGGNKVGKRGLFDIDKFECCVRYCNISKEKKPDILSDALSLPVKTGSIDVVICAEVLEHLLHPEMVILEMHRVLKPNGILLISVPFMFGIHADPYDYARYTESFWKHLFKETPFSHFTICAQGSFRSVFVDMVKQWFNEEPHNFFIRVIMPLVLLVFQHRAISKDSRKGTISSFGKRFTTGYGIVARK